MIPEAELRRFIKFSIRVHFYLRIPNFLTKLYLQLSRRIPRRSTINIRHINAISLYVADIARSSEFYNRVFEAEVIEAGPGNVVVKLEGIFLNLLDMSLAYAPTDPDRGEVPLELSIWVEDVDAAYAELLERGVEFLAPPEDQPWGMRTVTFFDPDRHRFEIAQHVG